MFDIGGGFRLFAPARRGVPPPPAERHFQRIALRFGKGQPFAGGRAGARVALARDGPAGPFLAGARHTAVFLLRRHEEGFCLGLFGGGRRRDGIVRVYSLYYRLLKPVFYDPHLKPNVTKNEFGTSASTFRVTPRLFLYSYAALPTGATGPKCQNIVLVGVSVISRPNGTA